MKFIHAFFMGLCGVGGYVFVNMMFIPSSDPLIGLVGSAIIFVCCFIVGLFDYDKKKRKREEEEMRQEEQDRNNELLRELLEKNLREGQKDK
jgi:hypothetical protein